MSNIFDMFDKFINEGMDTFHTGETSNSKNQFDEFDEDSEDVFTSKELVKMKNPPVSPDKKIVAPSGIPEGIEEECHFKTYSKRRQHKYTESEMEKIRAECQTVIVHDYSQYDSYHLSDEERYRNDSLREIAPQLAGLHKMYNKVDQWIEAMRIVVKAWELLEQRDNFIHSEKEFFQMVAEGRIYHNRIIMPKLKGAGKYNADILIQYISNPELDPKDLLTAEQKKARRGNIYYDDFYDEEETGETMEEAMNRLLTPEEADYILQHQDNPESIEVHVVPDKMIRGYDNRRITSKLKKHKSKKLKAKERFRNDLHDILNRIQDNPRNQSSMDGYSRLITQSMFEPQKKQNDFWDDLRFQGSFASKTDNYIYDLQVREKLMEQTIPGQRYVTYGDSELNDFFTAMESAGLNVLDLRRRLNMTDADIRSRTDKLTTKATKKLENAILQRITKLNDDPKFKKTIAKAEKAINEEMSDN